MPTQAPPAELVKLDREAKQKQTQLDKALRDLADAARRVAEGHKKVDREVKDLARTKLGAEGNRGQTAHQSATRLGDEAQKLAREVQRLQQTLSEWETTRKNLQQTKANLEKQQKAQPQPGRGPVKPGA